MFVALKPLGERKLSADQVIARLRPKLAQVPGASLFLQAVQDIRVGGRQSNAQYQFTLQADNAAGPLRLGARSSTAALQHDAAADRRQLRPAAARPADQPRHRPRRRGAARRDTRSRSTTRSTTPSASARSRRSTCAATSTMSSWRWRREYWQNPGDAEGHLRQHHRRRDQRHAGDQRRSSSTDAASAARRRRSADRAGGAQPAHQRDRHQRPRRDLDRRGRQHRAGDDGPAVGGCTSYDLGTTPLAVNHQGLFVASTISFNLAPGMSLSDAVAGDRTARCARSACRRPSTARFQGTARAFQQSLDNQLLLILAALVAVYIVLGMLYESYIHPITILSTLPSAGVGALLALHAVQHRVQHHRDDRRASC